MIYGYGSKAVNEFGLMRMSEISLSASPTALRGLAAFLLLAADASENAASEHWHKHVPKVLRDSLECDVVVLRAETDHG